ncbi:MAG TPA: hypothetical protein VND88_03320 [Candidatus Acidoferrales bacterium]|nr:hypothetical protein [Candidatus Acidoferrales bacterium]
MPRSLLALLTTVLVAITACGSLAADAGSGTPAPTPYPTPVGGLGHRPSSPVKITLLSPVNGSTVHGTSVLVRVSVTGGEVTPAVTGNITPTKGHVHLYLNNQLIYMSYTLQQEITVHPGVEYSMYAEFVAQDHFPFSPRDVTPTIYFTVAPA